MLTYVPYCLLCFCSRMFYCSEYILLSVILWEFNSRRFKPLIRQQRFKCTSSGLFVPQVTENSPINFFEFCTIRWFLFRTRFLFNVKCKPFWAYHQNINHISLPLRRWKARRYVPWSRPSSRPHKAATRLAPMPQSRLEWALRSEVHPSKLKQGGKKSVKLTFSFVSRIRFRSGFKRQHERLLIRVEMREMCIRKGLRERWGLSQTCIGTDLHKRGSSGWPFGSNQIHTICEHFHNLLRRRRGFHFRLPGQVTSPHLKR